MIATCNRRLYIIKREINRDELCIGVYVITERRVHNLPFSDGIVPIDCLKCNLAIYLRMVYEV